MMKRFLGIFVFLFFSLQNSNAQKRSLKIGDRLPDIEIAQIINFSKQKTNLSYFKGKALILDFWATWCSPCIQTFGKLDSLQKEFVDDLQIMPVTKQDEQITFELLNNLKKFRNLPLFQTVVNDTILYKLFPHSSIPHYVWIDPEGIVSAITGPEELTETNVRQFIERKSLNLPIKLEKKYDYTKPFFGGNQVELNQEDIIYQSILTKFIPNLRTTSGIKKNYIECSNHSILLLFKIAFGEFDLAFINNNRVVLEGFKTQEDSLMIGRYTLSTKKKWQQIKHENLYCYELIMPDSSMSRHEKFVIMQNDLNRMFSRKGLSARIEKRKMPVICLVQTSAEDKVGSKGGEIKDIYSDFSITIRNLPISRLLMKLQAFFPGENELPIMDKTNYHNKRVDIDITADLRDIDAVNRELEKYNLKFINAEEKINMLVIAKNEEGNK